MRDPDEYLDAGEVARLLEEEQRRLEEELGGGQPEGGSAGQEDSAGLGDALGEVRGALSILRLAVRVGGKLLKSAVKQSLRILERQAIRAGKNALRGRHRAGSARPDTQAEEERETGEQREDKDDPSRGWYYPAHYYRPCGAEEE